METQQTLSLVRAYHRAWTSREFGMAAELLADPLEVEVPINTYPTKLSFVNAVTSFGSMVESVDLLCEMANGTEAMQLYDLQVADLGPIRIAEHFTVSDGRITRVRQIHDTAIFRRPDERGPA